MKAVLISIQPKWCELIASGKKVVEVRKTKPKTDVPFKCYIYQTKLRWVYTLLHALGFFAIARRLARGVGKVIGEFVCERIQSFESEFVDDYCYEFVASLDYDEDGDATGFIEWSNDSDFSYESTDFYKKCCVKYEELKNYMGQGINEFYGWHISDLVIYDNPKELSEFRKYISFLDGEDTAELEEAGMSKIRMKRPPQSWCYVEELK